LVVAFLSLVSILAALPPVLRAARIDPMWALRYE
jgi:ABC-type lipoprotein release transport system permease subunit